MTARTVGRSDDEIRGHAPDYRAAHDTSAEADLIGLIFAHPQRRREVFDALPVEAFYHQHHRIIYAVIKSLYEQGREELMPSAILQKLPEDDRLSALLILNGDGIPRSLHITEPVASILKCERVRQVSELLLDSLSASQSSSDPNAGLDTLLRDASDLQEEFDRVATTHPRTLTKTLPETLDWLTTQHDGREFIGLATDHLPTLNNRTNGLRGLVVFSSMPGIGKTSFGVDVGLSALRRHADDPLGACFVFFSLDQPRRAMELRMLARASGLPWPVVRRGDMSVGVNAEYRFTPEQSDRFATGVAELQQLGNRITIIDAGDLPPTLPTSPSRWFLRQIMQAKQAAAAQRAFVLIDYLQIIPTSTEPGSGQLWRSDLERDRYLMQELAAVSRDMPDEPLFVISEQTKSGWGHAHLNSTLGSGRTVYSADLCAFLQPDPNAADSTAADSVEVDFVIQKGRDGTRRGAIPMTFHYQMAEFAENPDRQPFGPDLNQSRKPKGAA